MSVSKNRKRKLSVSSSQSSSPNKRQKLPEGLKQDPISFQTEFQQGQIVRIELKNWVTFDSTVIECEPGLNLIVGPNGTGKSSIVCAICIGLGGKFKSLGRAEKAAQFIKYGREKAMIKIELYNASKERNDVIERMITKNKSSWFLNRKAVTGTQIQTFIKDQRNIKVDNLCQFLAQDKVSEFAALSPKQLLIETEKAIEDDQLWQWHEFLIQKGETASGQQSTIDNLRTSLHRDQNEIATLQRTIEQFEQKRKYEEQIEVYKALKWHTEAEAMQARHRLKMKETQQLRRTLERKAKHLEPCRKQSEHWRRKVIAADKQIGKTETALKQADRRRTAAHAKLEQRAENIRKLEDDMKREKEERKQRVKRGRKLREEIDKLQEDVDRHDESEIEQAQEERKRIQRGALSAARNERNAFDSQLRVIDNGRVRARQQLRQIDQQLETWTNTARQRDDHIFGTGAHREREFKLFVDRHRHEFEGEVYGPIVQEMTVRNELHCKFLNASLPRQALYGYVCTNGRDWNRLLQRAHEMNLKFTVYLQPEAATATTHVHRPVDTATLRRHGVDGYLDEIFEARPLIQATLNDQFGLSSRAYAMQELDAAALDNVLVTTSGQSGRLKSLLTPSSQYAIKESAYSQQVLRSLGNLHVSRQACILRTTPDFSQQIAAKTAEKQRVQQELDEANARHGEAQQGRQQKQVEIETLAKTKKQLDDKVAAFHKLTQKLHKKRKDLTELEKETQTTIDEFATRINDDIVRENCARIELFERVAEDLGRVHTLLQARSIASIEKRQHEAQHQHIKQMMADFTRRHKELRTRHTHCQRQEQELKRQHRQLYERAEKKYPRRKFVDVWSGEDKQLSLDEVESKINHIQGRINVLYVDPERVKKYERLEAAIESQTKELQQLEADFEEQSDAIDDIEARWQPQLQKAVAKISAKFGEFFRQFNNAQGRVCLVSEDDDKRKLPYSEWCIDIETKFRSDEHTPWKRLTSSAQSGGEKSVSTMLYLLSLKEVTTVPFRVVDEINQGMDPVNERRIMEILNYECTPQRMPVMSSADGGGGNGDSVRLPQYFVVTPKLLPRLQYSPCSSVYVIFNGPYQMPQEAWTMSKFIQSQKDLSQCQSQSQQEQEPEQE
eukprot:CAMPEP_0202693706 /NCGR_PEP_ID=MMETSP1385-20130828/7743_1 /ASSEMBLY_ACC=CAM_ASM_000861 /TAXON_ID=933848 /ORGANISM="Elphidium margaritaceum" /LENGTH=1126 /DNA_ID=CAMNT_0049349423 /DNA_START=60 /DNA_END=3440 /DNA_ORIENTATION=+